MRYEGVKRKKKVNPRKEGWNKEVRGPAGGRRRNKGSVLKVLMCVELRRLGVNRQFLVEGVYMDDRRGERGKVWVEVFPDVPVTKKPREVRMGRKRRKRGKG